MSEKMSEKEWFHYKLGPWAENMGIYQVILDGWSLAENDELYFLNQLFESTKALGRPPSFWEMAQYFREKRLNGDPPPPPSTDNNTAESSKNSKARSPEPTISSSPEISPIPSAEEYKTSESSDSGDNFVPETVIS